MTRHGFFLFVLSSFFLFGAAACGGGGGGEEPSAEATRATAGGEDLPRGGARVSLVERGAEPRHVLRYALDEGQVMRGRLETRIGITTTIGGQAQPRVALPTIVFDLELGPVARDGDRYVVPFRYTGLSVDAGEDVAPEVADAMRQQLEPMTNVSGVTSFTERGEVVGFSLEVPDTVPEAIRGTLGQLEESMRQLVVPLPEEAVGAGARFTVEQSITMSGVAADQTVTFVLVEVEEHRFAARVTVEQRGRPGPMPSPSGTTAELVSLESHMEGDVAFDLRSVVPESRLEGRSVVVVDARSGEETSRFEVRTEMETRLSPAP